MEHAWSTDRILTHLQAARQLYRAQEDPAIEFPPPRFLSIWLSEVCNLDCTYCYFAEGNHDKARTFVNTPGMLDWLRRMKNFGAEALEFSGGGEPTLHPDFGRFVDETHAMGYELGLITHACNEMPLEALVSKTHYVRCGLDAATAETHDKIKRNKRKGYWFHRALENIRELARLRDERGGGSFTVGIKIVLNSVNCHELEAMIFLARELKVNYIQVKYEHSSDHPIDDVGLSSLQQILDREVEANGTDSNGSFQTKVLGTLRHQRATVKCFMSPIHTVVTAAGDILQCCFFDRRPIGTIWQPIRDVWGGPKHREVMRMTTVEECDKLDCRWNYYNRRAKELVEDPLAQMSFI